MISGPYGAAGVCHAGDLTAVASSAATTCSATPQNSDRRGRSSVITCSQRGTDVLGAPHAVVQNAALISVEMATSSNAAITAAGQTRSRAGGEVVAGLLFAETGNGALECVFQPSASNANVRHVAPTGANAGICHSGPSPNGVSASTSDVARDYGEPRLPKRSSPPAQET